MLDPRGAELHVDRLFPAGGLAQLFNLDPQVVRPGPVRVPRRRALVDPGRQRTHASHPLADLLAKQHPTAAGLGSLADDYFDRVSRAQMIQGEPVPRWQALVHQLP